MRYKALVSFCGPLTMSRGQERELDEKQAENLVKCGYLRPVYLAAALKPEKTPEPEEITEQEETSEPEKTSEAEEIAKHEETSEPEEPAEKDPPAKAKKSKK